VLLGRIPIALGDVAIAMIVSTSLAIGGVPDVAGTEVVVEADDFALHPPAVGVPVLVHDLGHPLDIGIWPDDVVAQMHARGAGQLEQVSQVAFQNAHFPASSGAGSGAGD